MSVSLSSPEIDEIVSQYRHMASSPDFIAASPLYAAYGRHVIGVPKNLRRHNILFEIFNAVDPSSQQPSLLLASVKYALLSGVDPWHPLHRYYRLFKSKDPVIPDRNCGYALEDFCRRNRDFITDVMRSRVVAVFESNRCGIFAPLIRRVNDETGLPVALREFGTGLGFNMMLDRFSYKYIDDGTGRVTFGFPPEMASSSMAKPYFVPIETHYAHASPLSFRTPDIANAVGYDKNLLDVRIESNRNWLLASVWEGDHARMNTLYSVSKEWQRKSPVIRNGEVVELFRRANWQSGHSSSHSGLFDFPNADDIAANPLDDIPDATAPVFLFSYVLTWMTERDRRSVFADMARLARGKPFHVILMEQRGVLPVIDDHASPKEEAYAGLLRFDATGVSEIVRGVAQPHGRTAELALSDRVWTPAFYPLGPLADVAHFSA
jgi:hypothetical protein